MRSLDKPWCQCCVCDHALRRVTEVWEDITVRTRKCLFEILLTENCGCSISVRQRKSGAARPRPRMNWKSPCATSTVMVCNNRGRAATPLAMLRNIGPTDAGRSNRAKISWTLKTLVSCKHVTGICSVSIAVRSCCRRGQSDCKEERRLRPHEPRESRVKWGAEVMRETTPVCFMFVVQVLRERSSTSRKTRDETDGGTSRCSLTMFGTSCKQRRRSC